MASEAKQSIFSSPKTSKKPKTKELLFLKKKKQKDFAPAGVGAGIAYNRHLRRRL